jgi:Icc-related predicted phosphoesterase
LITHGPPKSILFYSCFITGYCFNWILITIARRSKSNKGIDIGDEELLKKVKEIKPLVHVFGHVHASYGIDKGISNIVFINACSVNNSYHAKNLPIIFDLIINNDD